MEATAAGSWAARRLRCNQCLPDHKSDYLALPFHGAHCRIESAEPRLNRVAVGYTLGAQDLEAHRAGADAHTPV